LGLRKRGNSFKPQVQGRFNVWASPRNDGSGLGGWADLADADLRGANLTGADLFFANLAGANFVDANLNGAFLGNTIGAAFYNANTDFSGVYFSQSSQAFFFDPVAAGWTFVPETGRAHLVGFGLAGLAGRRR
jgi:uncharacterized protein YjbI with pentapeptide repeats